MVTQAVEVERSTTRRPYTSTIRWGAIFAGAVAGIATYLLLNLFGLAVGLTALDPAEGEVLGRVPLWTGIWTGISMLVAAFVGGFVAGKMSGLARLADGLLHGFVAWGTITLFLAYLTTTAVGAVLGGTMGILGQGIQAAGEAPGAAGQLQQLLTGTEQEAQITPQSLSALQERLQAQDRAGAVNLMVNEMGFSQERATQIVDQAMPLFGPEGQQQIQQVAGQAVEALTAASWWLFFGLVLSLGLGMWGGAVGTRTTSKRTWGDHSGERHYYREHRLDERPLDEHRFGA